MRHLILPLVVLALLAGCASIGDRADKARVVIQKALDAVLSPTFTGETYFSTKVTYGAFPVRVTLRAGGLQRTPQGWEWAWLSYSGNSPISETTFISGTPTPTTLIP